MSMTQTLFDHFTPRAAVPSSNGFCVILAFAGNTYRSNNPQVNMSKDN